MRRRRRRERKKEKRKERGKRDANGRVKGPDWRTGRKMKKSARPPPHPPPPSVVYFINIPTWGGAPWLMRICVEKIGIPRFRIAAYAARAIRECIAAASGCLESRSQLLGVAKCRVTRDPSNFFIKCRENRGDVTRQRDNTNFCQYERYALNSQRVRLSVASFRDEILEISYFPASISRKIKLYNEAY